MYEGNFPLNSTYGHYSTHIFTRRAENVILTHKDREEPMFLFLSYQAPHTPLYAPKVYKEMYDTAIPNGPRKTYAAMVTGMYHYNNVFPDYCMAHYINSLDALGYIPARIMKYICLVLIVIAQWENECISLAVLGSIANRGGIFQEVSPWLIWLNLPSTCGH